MRLQRLWQSLAAIRIRFSPGSRQRWSSTTKLFVFVFAVLMTSCQGDHRFDIQQPIGAAEDALNTSPEIGDFVLYAERSISLGRNDVITAGDIGVRTVTVPGFGTQLRVGDYSNVERIRNLLAPSASLGYYAHVGGVQTDALQKNRGSTLLARGSFPAAVMPSLPVVLSTLGGGPDVDVGVSQVVTLAPGDYGALHVAGTVVLTQGVYSFDSVTLEDNAHLSAGGGGVFVHVESTLAIGRCASVGPQTADAGELQISVFGGDGQAGDPPAASIGDASIFTALLAAPQGTVAIEDGVFATGAFAGLDIRVGPHASVTFQRGFPSFCPLGDTDGDGVSDCQDACFLDPKKTAPRVCGCGVTDTDTDGDGIPDCVDYCPNDTTKSVPGQCGCAGNATPAGTPCSDGICAGLSGGEQMCNGSGQCGDPEACSPDPGHCVAKEVGLNIFWICTGPATWEEANAHCASVPGQSLARIDSRGEDAILADFVSAPVWLGGNDLSAIGTWRWASGSNPDGDVFFAGGAPASGRYNNWRAGAPLDNAGRCAAMLADKSGQWNDRGCADALGYICERTSLILTGPTSPPLQCSDFSPNLVCPATTSCVPSDPTLPATEAEFVAQVQTCLDNCEFDGDPGCALCQGAATIPPPGAVCPPYGSTPCGLVNPHGTCTQDADCAPGESCDLASDCTACEQNNPERDPTKCAAVCPSEAKLMCGTRVAGCGDPIDPSERCLEVSLCAPPGSSGDPNPFHDPATDLTPETFDPAQAFTPPPAPVASYPPDPACPSPPCNLGPNNGWCKYIVPTQLPTQTPSDAKHGQSGSGGLIQFDFDPSLTLSFDATPLALGEARFNLEATAALRAGATFNIGSIGSSSFDIFDAVASLKANRCRSWTSDSQVKVFEIDFLPSQMMFDTDPDVLSQANCNKAIDQFQTTVDRAKKALKDAQELLRQYNAAKAAGGSLPRDLCQKIASDPPSGFPAGDCATELPEATINRFIDFYTQQVKNAFAAQGALASQVLSVGPPPISLVADAHEEAQTLYNTTILVGPIPVNVQIQSVEHYGIGGRLDFAFNPGSILLSGNREEIAHVSGDVHPFANAGVSLFLGVGFDIGIASASAGVEGIVTLGNITAPLVAGAGIDVQPEPDPRPLPADLAAVAGPVPILQPTQYQFLLKYNYGAKVDINRILAGELDARVRVKFLFFSKTWRAKIVDFGDGFSLPSLVLIQGQSGGTAIGDAPWATVQMPSPWVSLAHLPVPATPPTPGGVEVPFDTSQVEEIFYDSLCTCVDPGGACFRNADCCPGAPVCFNDPLTEQKICSACRELGESCNTKTDCCPGRFIHCGPAPFNPNVNICQESPA